MIIKPSPRLAGSVRRVLVAVGLGATLVLGSAGAASAGTWSFNDPTKDVVVITEDDDEDFDFQPAPERAVGDVQRIAVSHMQSKLVVRITLRQSLPRTDWALTEYIRTPRAMFGLGLFRFDGGGSVTLNKFTAKGGRVRCAGLAIAYAPRSVQISIPSRCLGTPRVVKVGAIVNTWEGEGTFYEDDALRRGMGEMGPRFSPQIPRG